MSLKPVAAAVNPLHLKSGKELEPTHVGCYCSGAQIANGDRRDAGPTLKQIVIVVGCLSLVTLAGCRSPGGAAANRADEEHERAVIEARTKLVFTNAVLVKPREDVPTTNLDFKLAPLLIREVTGSPKGTNLGPDTIYYQMSAVEIAGINHLQMTYLWTCGKGTQTALGVRLTLDSQGLPVIWEVLDQRPDPSVVFVSQSLEEKAKVAFGSPVPGRRFAVEQPLSVAPDVVVARVIEDGPVAMGPIVHQTASGEINAVICRCMPTQARQLVTTTYYELKPLSAATNVDLEILGTNRRFVKKLRLPPGF